LAIATAVAWVPSWLSDSEMSSIQWRASASPLAVGDRHRGGVGAVVAERQRDVLDPMAGERVSGGRRAGHARRAVAVRDDFEIARLQLTHRGLARKEFQTRFLGRKARGEPRGLHRAGAAVQFGRGKYPQQVRARQLVEQAAHAGDRHQVDSAARGRLRERGWLKRRRGSFRCGIGRAHP
jgi:hypothetical protein